MTLRHTATGEKSIRTRALRTFRTGEQRQATLPPALPPRFSVVLCTYNRRNMVLTTLASLRKQTLAYRDFEVIVVDNGSSDGTFNAIQTYLCAEVPNHRASQEPWQTHCLIEKQNGLAYARNAGLQFARGEIVVFLDDDVIVEPRFLERLASVYTETGAAAVGGSVNIHWEAPRPYWLTNDLLEMLGYYMPYRARTVLPTALDFSNSCFSVRRSVLQQIGDFSPFLTKRLHTPINVEVSDLCRRLRLGGFTLWYEPTAMVFHRASRARLEKAFFVGRAYWLGRSEILAAYADVEHYRDASGSSLPGTIRSILPALGALLHVILIHRPLLHMARKSTHELLLASMEQARCWGRIQQQFMLSNHAPVSIHMHKPAILVVHAQDQDIAPLLQGLSTLGLHCTTSIASIPFSWLWRHRTHQDQAIGIIHLVQPGAFETNHWQRQRFLFLLWLAQRLGIRIASSDAGGWWQSVSALQFSHRRSFERKILACSNIIHTFTRHVDLLYPDTRLRHRTCYYAHPGLRGTLSARYTRAHAHTQLGLPPHSGTVYLCFADRHAEREVLQCIEAFSEMRNALFYRKEELHTEPQLLLIGSPRDKPQSAKMLKRAALNPAIHLFLENHPEDLPLYVAATDVLVMPYFAHKNAGDPSLAMLFYSYERVVIAPRLPRFHEFLPSYATLLYEPDRHSTLVQALLSAPRRAYRHTEKEMIILDAATGWHHYAHHLVETYKPVLKHPTSSSPEH